MAWSDKDLIYSQLFIAVPELLFEDAIVKYLRRRGLINDDAYEYIRGIKSDQEALRRIRKKAKKYPVMQRLFAVAPEILTPGLTSLLRSAGVIDKNDADLINLIVDRIGIAREPMDTGTLAQRARRLLSTGYVEEGLLLLRSVGAIDPKQANQVRAAMMGGGLSVETLKSIRNAKSMLEILQLVGSGLVDRRAIRALRLSGLINDRIANSLLAALDYGSAQWTVWEGAKRAEGLAARMAYVVSGSFSFEALEVLSALEDFPGIQGKITAQQRALLEIAVQMSQRYNRVLMEQMTDRKFRVVPGESPIVTYARQSKELDDDLLKLLAQAADESRLAARRLAGAARGAEYALRAQALHQAMRKVWEGTGYLTIFHERQVADAATAASEELMKKYYKNMTPFAKTMMEYQARSGLDSYISRKENTLPLSRRVYGNINVWTRKVDQQISLGLLQGESAEEMAKRITPFINPKVMGGVKYAAFRLGRTELANAFHQTTIRGTREMPWVRGYKWNKSSSHRHGDICDEYAENDHDGLGPGVFKKANVPGKPHPQCLCYLTVVGMTDDEFVKAYKKGRFNDYMSLRVDEAGIRGKLSEEIIDRAAKASGRILGQVALTQATSLGTRMLMGAGEKTRLVTKNTVLKEDQRIPGKPRTSPSQKNKFFAQTVDVEAKVESALENAAYTREYDEEFPLLQKKFASLSDDAVRYNKRYPKKGGQIKFKPDSFDQLSYEEILPNDTDALSKPTLASTMYGTTAYRTMNANLRKANGNLDQYDDLFDEQQVFEDLGQLIATKNMTMEQLEQLNNKLFFSLDEGDPLLENKELYYNSLFKNVKDFDVTAYEKHSDIIRRLDRRMEPISGDRFTYRITGKDWFGLGDGEELTKDHIGLTFHDSAYTSTEGVKRYFNGGGGAELGISSKTRQYRVQILLPDGTMATRINDIEYEILTSRGSTFQVLDVIDGNDEFLKTVYVGLKSQTRLDDWEEKVAEDSADFWDDIVMDF